MIKIIPTRTEILELTRSLNPKTTGVVPTMGNLHEGHMSLIKQSLNDNEDTIVTIFVNPKQFGPNEDFDKYPRTLENDVNLIQKTFHKELEKKNLFIFAPKSVGEIYPQGFDTTIKIGEITNILCGANRPGHFDGVTTVVYQLFHLANAYHAYFGQKDFQQVKVIQKMIDDLSLNVKIFTMPISRDNDGLARSSRNQYLSTSDRTHALILPKTLIRIEDLLKKQSWLHSFIELNNIIEENMTLKNTPIKWDYIEILDSKNLNEVTPSTTSVAILGALRINGTRLIDNRIVDIRYDG